MNVFFVATHAQNIENSADYAEAIKIDLLSCDQQNKLKALTNNSFPVELIGNEHYQKFEVKKIFAEIYEKYKEHKIYKEINENNIDKIDSIFFKDINSKKSMICHISSLAKRVRANFKLLASSLDNSISVEGTIMLSVAVIKIIVKPIVIPFALFRKFKKMAFIESLSLFFHQFLSNLAKIIGD